MLAAAVGLAVVLVGTVTVDRAAHAWARRRELAALARSHALYRHPSSRSARGGESSWR
jgi:hypothetical protein